jgi:hypothetical protein
MYDLPYSDLIFCPYFNLTYRSMAEPKGKKGNRSYLAWTADMDAALLAMLVEHHNNGDHAQNGWKPHVYNACIKHVKEKCDVVINKDKIQARIKTFDKHYEIISKMLAQSGFGWDWENNMVMVDSDEVWSRYVEVANTIYLILCLLMERQYYLLYLNMCVICRLTRKQVATGTRS